MGHTLNPSTMEAGGIREFKVILSHLASSRPAWDPETLSQRQQKRFRNIPQSLPCMDCTSFALGRNVKHWDREEKKLKMGGAEGSAQRTSRAESQAKG